MRPATSHDVARLAGVSQPTVSRALRDDPRVSQRTRERVREAAAALGYVASRRGRSLSTRTTGQVALVTGQLANPFYSEATKHLHAALTAAGHGVELLTELPDGPPIAAERLLDGAVDGVILTTTALDSRLPRQLAARGLPVVLFNRAVDDDAIDVCESDNAAGGRLVARTLLELGHREIGAIFGPLDTSTGRDRELAFRAVLADGGVALADTRIRRGPFAHAAGHRAFGELLAVARPPSAIFCANDVIALGALNAAAGSGIAVPRDVTVVGFDDIAPAAWELCRLTTVRQDLAAMASATVRLLGERIAAPDLPGRRERIPVRLVRRGSHAAPPR
ncbi:LacI family DNA-binding transcriptional regulator [Conexibacter sp. CPCC 206217]|uniref:LacI family DNA-binding transcriptional regulator n=1 Tax=Conexibacter sp. CPCC 206217 TaxID=3064574 RepID=UPI0027273FE0|nr:LacI family DNA-binding transcriptional regulator [Conexibacter sp. CPCC 206217]MDO8210290.1 LacI family DNA-binding transcriptional regulator [Conexibacter sp. CPCC 206217]